MSPTLVGAENINGGSAAQIGEGNGHSGGNWACSLLVDLGVDATVRDAAVRDYILQRFGMKI